MPLLIYPLIQNQNQKCQLNNQYLRLGVRKVRRRIARKQMSQLQARRKEGRKERTKEHGM